MYATLGGSVSTVTALLAHGAACDATDNVCQQRVCPPHVNFCIESTNLLAH
jgi:hypothetical protein